MRQQKNVSLFIILIIGVLVLINFLANQFFFRLDFTEDNRYTLSRATRNVLKNLEEPVTINAYFSGKLPPQLDLVKRDFRNMLIEYSNRSNGNIAYEFLDPLKDEQVKNQATQAGINQIQVQVEEKDEIKAQIAFMGANIQLGEENEVIPMITSLNGLEYKLTSAIKKLSVTDKPVIGFVTGHGEATFGQIWQAKQALDVLYSSELVNLSDSLLNLSRYKTLVILNPTDSVSDRELSLLDQYLDNGCRMLVAINRCDADLTSEQFSRSVSTGFETWLGSKGIDVNTNTIIDQNCQSGFIQPQPNYYMQVMVPYMMIIQNFGDHPVSSGLEQVLFNFSSSVSFSGDSTVKFTPLVMSSKKSASKPADGYIDIMKEWTEADFPMSEITLAAAIEGNFGRVSTKLVVIGDGEFALQNERQQQVHPDNINLLVNSINWLSDDTGLVELRTRGATARPLEDIEDSKRSFLKFLNFLLPVFLALAYGIFRYQQNRIKRTKRMEAGYVQ